MQVIDTNILAYYLLEGIYSDQVLRIAEMDPDWHSESYLLIEFTNVLARQLSANILPLSKAQDVFAQALQKMGNSLHEMPHLEVLALCATYKVTAYDARFLLLAQKLGLKLITEDKKLRTAAPKLTQSIEEALDSAA